MDTNRPTHRDTKFLTSSSSQKNKTSIRAIRNSGQTVNAQKEIEEAFKSYYQNLYNDKGYDKRALRNWKIDPNV